MKTTILIAVAVSSAATFFGARESTRDSDSYTFEELSRLIESEGWASPCYGISERIPATIVLPNETIEGTLYRFHGNPGYILCGDDFDCFAIEEEALPESVQNPIFYAETGALRYDGFQQLRDLSATPRANDSSSGEDAGYSSGGEIPASRLNQYVREHFSGGVFDGAIAIASYSDKTQGSLSSFRYRVPNDDGGFSEYSEGNCYAVATYNVLFNLCQKNYGNYFSAFPSLEENYFYDPAVEDPQGCVDWTNRTFSDPAIVKLPPKSFSTTALYAKIREVANRISPSCFAKETPLSINNTSRLAEETADEFGLPSLNGIEEFDHATYSGSATFKSDLNKGVPSIFMTQGGYYGNHFIAVFGVEYYKRESQVLWWTKTEWNSFLEVANGWKNGLWFFDLSRYEKENWAVTGFIRYEF